MEPQKKQRDSIGTVLYGLYLLFLLLSVVVLVRIAYLQLFYKPDPAIAARYEDRYQRFRTLYPALKDVYKGLR